MYGKSFEAMYSGSMFGKPALVFAVWGYVISFQRPSREDGECYVELNPTLLAATFATTPAEVLEAIGTLEEPDPTSRTPTDDGRRLILVGEKRHHGPMQFRVVNGPKYRAMRDEEERRAYFRETKREQRKMSKTSLDIAECPPLSTQAVGRGKRQKTEAEAGESKEGAAKSAARSPRKKSGTAMTEDWTPSPDLVESMQAECPAVDVRRQIPQFRDYWIGEGKVKADWSATFRNWIRRQDGYRQNRGPDRRPASSDPGAGAKPRGMRAKDFGLRTLADLDAELLRDVPAVPDASPAGTPRDL